MTTATGTTASNGQSMSLGFGNGVTATYTQGATTNNPPFCGGGQYAGPGGVLSGTNVVTFLEPDPPGGSVSVSQCIGNAAIGVLRTVPHTFSFNKPVIGPVLHFQNLDGSVYDVSATTTSGGAVTYAQLAKNNAMEVAALSATTTRFNDTPQLADNGGCMGNAGGNPTGGCGSFRLNGGPVQTWTAANRQLIVLSGGDGWFWSVSFQLARLNKAFGAASIVAGQATTLTFTIDNTNATNGTNASTAIALGPLDFTDVLPAGMTIANGTTSSTCAGATFQDASSGALAAGDTGVRVSGFTVPANASCTLTVNVTAASAGTYSNTAANMSSGIGNLVLAPNASLTVVALPRVTISKVSLGGTGAFSFTGTNGIAAQTLTTTIAGTAVSGSPQSLTAASTATTISEAAPPAGYALTGISCTNLPSGGTATPDLSTRTVSLNAAATAAGADVTCTFTNTLAPQVTISKASLGGTGAFSFTGSNGIAAQTLTTTVAGTAVSGAAQTLTTVGAVTAITEGAPPAGYTLTGISCTNLPAGGTATPDLSTRTVTLNAAATAAGANPTCTFTNTLAPRVTINKVSLGGTGAFSFTGSNGIASQTLTTTVAGTAVSGTAQTLTTVGAVTTITEGAPPAGYALTGISCTNLPAGGTATPDLATRTVTLNAAATAAGANVTCTFTNTLAPRVTISKVSLGGAGAFSFTGSNGIAAQTLTTTVAGTVVSGAVQTLTTVGAVTTITESAPPAGYMLTGISCNNLPVGGTATPDLATRTVTLNAAATAAGANATCTFTNTLAPRVTINKVSLGGTGAFSFTGSNGIAAQTLTTTVAGTAVGGTAQTLTTVGAVTTITEGAPPAGYTLTGISCANLPAGGTATADLATRTVTLNAGATAAGANATCTFTNTLASQVTISKVSLGGTGAFSFTGSNGIAAQTLTTTVAGTAVSGAPQPLTTVGTSTTITEAAPPAGYTLTGISCTNLPSGGTATPNLATRTVSLNAAATAAGANLTCTFTNTLAPQVTISKVSLGGTGAFSFTGSNGIAAQTLTTTVAGTAVSGAPQTLTTVGAATTVTEGVPPTGYVLTAISCTNLPSGGTATPNLATRTVSLNAAATAAGANVTCTFTNTLTQPSLSITKASNGPWTVGQPGATYTLNVSNGGNLATSGTVTVRDQLPAGIGIRPASGFTAAASWTCTYSDEAAQGNSVITPSTGMLVNCTSTTAIAIGGSVALTLPVVVTSASTASVTNHASVGGGGDPFNGGNAPTAGTACSDTAHCTSATTGITASPPPPASCPSGAAVNLFAPSPFQGTFVVDNTTQTQTATLLPAAGSYTLGTGAAGRFVVDMNWRWSSGIPQPSNASTMTLRVNGTDYATLTTQAGFAGFGTLVALNGASLFGGTSAVETNRISTENVWVTLPASVTTITSVQMVYGSGSVSDDFIFTGPALYGCLGAADLSVTKTNNTGSVAAGGTTVYTVVVTNNGPSAANNAVVSDDWSTVPGLDCSTVAGGGTTACTASGTPGTQCPATVTPELLQAGLAIPVLPSGGVVTFTLQCTVTASGQ